MGNVKTFDDLFQFYYSNTKILYSFVQRNAKLPQEVLFEINAAFDHIARHYYTENPQEEGDVVEKALSHLKRSCLDIFKLALTEANKQCDEINRLDLSIIDNGDGVFIKELKHLVRGIREKSEEARLKEGTDFDYAYNVWSEMFLDCMKLEKEFYYSEKLQWAKKKRIRQFIYEIPYNVLNNLISYVIVGAAASAVTAIVMKLSLN